MVLTIDTAELADLKAQAKEAKAAGVAAPPDVRSKLALHEQEEPYKLVELKKAAG